MRNVLFYKLFTTLIRPILEYSNSIWGPHFILDQHKVEKIQRRATKLIPSLQDNSYEERLSFLSLPSLSYRRLWGDLILLYKILNSYFNSDFTDLYTFSSSVTRGHCLNTTPGYYADLIISLIGLIIFGLNYQLQLWTVIRLTLLNHCWILI